MEDSIRPATDADAGAADPATPGRAPTPQYYRLTQAVVLAAVVVCAALAWWVGRATHVPAYAGYETSLLQQPGFGGKVWALVVAAGAFAACAAVGQLVAARWWGYAGLFAGAAGLAALSARGGPSRYVYFRAVAAGQAGSVYLTLAVELIFLSTVVGAVWYLLICRADRATVAARPGPDEATTPGDAARPPARETRGGGGGGGASARTQALGMQAALFSFGVLLLTRSDDKGGVLIAVFLSAFAATSLAEYWFKEARVGAWYWVSPLAVGVAGYLLNHVTGGDLAAGPFRGTFGALARPLPLDYAAVGTAGAVLGYWFGGDHPEPGDTSHPAGEPPAGRAASAANAAEGNGTPR